MQAQTLIIVLLVITAVVFQIARRRALSLARRPSSPRLHSLPGHYGWYAAIWCLLPALIVAIAWSAFESKVVTTLVFATLPDTYQALPADQRGLVINDIRNLVNDTVFSGETKPEMLQASEYYRHLKQISAAAVSVVAIVLAMFGALVAWRQVVPRLRARNHVERSLTVFLMACSAVAVLTTIGIVLSVLVEALRFFDQISFFDFILGLEWRPQTAIRADQVGASGAFGVVPLFVGTLLISAIAMFVAVPVGLFSAIYLAEYANARVRVVVKPLLEILAGIPTVVYGFFAALTVAPFLRGLGVELGLDVSSESALAAGAVMGIMIIPFISSVSDDVITTVPQALRDGSYALGATKSETVKRVVLPAALPGIVGGVLLAVSRAIGETMIVVMAAGLAANLTFNPLESVTTVTVQIVTLLVGDQEFDSAKTLSAFALGLVLFVVTLLLNMFALHVVHRYREQYE